MANLAEIKAGTLIGFSGNKTVETAKTDTATNRVDICTTKQLYFNGQRIGVTDKEQTFLENGVSTTGMAMASQIVMSTTNSQNIKDYIDDQVGNAVAGAYKFKKSVASLADLFKETTTKGDVYNITKDFDISSGDNKGHYQAGTNVAVKTPFTGNGTEEMIDPLGGTTVDLSPYVTKTSLEGTLGGYVTSSALTTKLGDYVTNTAQTETLKSYYTKTEINQSFAPILEIDATKLPETTLLLSKSNESDFRLIAQALVKKHYVVLRGTNSSGKTEYYTATYMTGAIENALSSGVVWSFNVKFLIGGDLVTFSGSYNGTSGVGTVTRSKTTYATSTDLQTLKSTVDQLKAQLLLA